MEIRIRFQRAVSAFMCIVLLMTAVPYAPASAASVTYRALIIGNNNYVRNPLSGCINDARALRSALQLSSIKYDRIELLTDLSTSRLDAALANLSTWGQNSSDVTLLFFSGHGFENSDGTQGIVGVDGYGISFRTIEQHLAKVPGTVAVLMDCCYSGGLIGKSSANPTPESFNEGVIDVFTSSAAQSKALSGTKYHVITACSMKELSYEAGGYGYFTTGITEAMGWNSQASRQYSSLIGDSNKDGKLSMSEAYNHARNVVSTLRRNGDQNVKVSPSGSSLSLVARSTSTPPTPTPTPTPTPEGTIYPGVAGMPNLPAIVISPGWQYQLASSGTRTWTSSKSSVASVSSKGLVTGRSHGQTTITGRQAGLSNITLKVTVTALSGVNQLITLNATGGSRAVGKPFTLKATVKPASANKTVYWYSTNKAVATVSGKGVVKPLKPGTAKIYCVGTSGIWAVCNLTVTERKVEKIEHKRSSVSVTAGKTLQLVARALPTTATNRNIDWYSSDTSIAVVGEESGIVRGIKKGNVHIVAEATDGSGISSKVLLTVK